MIIIHFLLKSNDKISIMYKNNGAFLMKTEYIFNLSYLVTVVIAAIFYFNGLKKSDLSKDSCKGISNHYNNIFFTLGIIIFLSALFITSFFWQIIVIMIATALIFFMFYSNLFAYLASEIFKKVDLRLHVLHIVFQVILIFIFEKARGAI